ncbi:MAG: response regulator [Eubacteriales bacterium]|nr:response regulator [Eubacteriales bacterium]
MKRLLIVDDEAFAREAVADNIPWKDYGIEVFQVSCGEDALALMKEKEIHLLMTDIRMPGMSGLELIEQVHRLGRQPGIIVLSSYNEFELVRSAMRLGAEDYLFKPTMMPDEILEAVQRVLEKGREDTGQKEEYPVKIRDYLRCLLQGEEDRPEPGSVSPKELKIWEERELVVIMVRLFRYQECLSGVFENDMDLFQFSIGNVLSEILQENRGYEIFRMNHMEYVAIAWKSPDETKMQAYAEIQNCFHSGFTFLKLYYQMEAAAGVSGFRMGLHGLAAQYAQAVEVCPRTAPEFQKVLYAEGLSGQGTMKREMYQALDFIGAHLGDKKLSLSMVADHIGVSKNYFSKIFKECTGVKFVDYVTAQRMEQARNLYLNSDLKIYEIAERVGYSDWHYLYNLYKKTYGHSLSKEKEVE